MCVCCVRARVYLCVWSRVAPVICTLHELSIKGPDGRTAAQLAEVVALSCLKPPSAKASGNGQPLRADASDVSDSVSTNGAAGGGPGGREGGADTSAVQEGAEEGAGDGEEQRVPYEAIEDTRMRAIVMLLCGEGR